MTTYNIDKNVIEKALPINFNTAGSATDTSQDTENLPKSGPTTVFWDVPLDGNNDILESAWDVLFLDGQQLPGICKVTNITREGKWDKKKSPGSSGATITFQGYEPTKVEVESRCWEREQLADMDRFLPMLEPKPGKKDPPTYVITHPATQQRGIHRVVVESVNGPTLADGIATYKITFVERAKPTPTKGSKKGAGTGKEIDVSFKIDKSLLPSMGIYTK